MSLINKVYTAQICGEIGEMVGREAACNQPVTDCHGLGNAAATRNALESVRNWCINKLVNAAHQLTVEGLFSFVNSALSVPPRNCDAFSKEQILEMLEDRSFSKEDTIEWLFAEAKGETDGSK